MTRRCLLVLVLAAIVAGGAFAQMNFSLSAGVGGSISTDNIMIISSNGYGYPSKNYSYMADTDYTVGGYAFFDATYAELSVGISSSTVSVLYSVTGEPNSDYKYFKTDLYIGILGKIPCIRIGDKITLFPFLGLIYYNTLSVEDENGGKYPKPGKFNQLWGQTGWGMDISINPNIYLRAKLLLGARLPTEYEKDILKGFPSDADNSILDSIFKYGANIAVGYRF